MQHGVPFYVADEGRVLQESNFVRRFNIINEYYALMVLRNAYVAFHHLLSNIHSCTNSTYTCIDCSNCHFYRCSWGIIMKITGRIMSDTASETNTPVAHAETHDETPNNGTVAVQGVYSK